MFDEILLKVIENKENEITNIERIIFTNLYSFSQNHLEILHIHSIPMLYSYWESFIIEAFRIFINFLNEENNLLQSYKDEIIIFHIESKVVQLKKREYPEKLSKKIEIYNNIYNEFNCLFLHNNINTKSNVKFDVLNELLQIFCLEKIKMQNYQYKYNISEKNKLTTKKCLDEFVNLRNSIAHGNQFSSSNINNYTYHEYFTTYKQLIIDLMYQIYENMVKAIKDKSYLKQ